MFHLKPTPLSLSKIIKKCCSNEGQFVLRSKCWIMDIFDGQGKLKMENFTKQYTAYYFQPNIRKFDNHLYKFINYLTNSSY